MGGDAAKAPDELARRAFLITVVGGEREAALCPRDLAEDIMALYGTGPAEQIAARLGPMAVRAASRARVQSPPTEMRFRAGAGDVTVTQLRRPYAKFFALEEYDVTWRRFDGGFGEPVTREVFVSAMR